MARDRIPIRKNGFPLTLASLLLFLALPALADTWSQAIGLASSTANSEGRCASPTSDGGSIVIGTSDLFGSDGSELWVVKLNASGGIDWQKRYGDSGEDGGAYIEQTSDGGYIACGYTNSFGAVNADGWVLKLYASGSVEWEYAYGWDDYEYLVMILPTPDALPDGGYIALGYTTADPSDPNYNDLWVLKLSSSGTIEWQKVYGGDANILRDGDDVFGYPKIRLTPDEGYVIISASNSFTPTGPDEADDYDGWALKLYSNGSIQYQTRFGGESDDAATGIDLIADSNYIVSGFYSCVTDSSQDGWVLKLDSQLQVGPSFLNTWQKRFTYGSGDYAGEINTIRLIGGGGFVAAGSTWDTSGYVDGWLLRLDSDGNIGEDYEGTWQKGYDFGATWDTLHTVQPLADGSYLAGGKTEYFSLGGMQDYWVVHADGSGDLGSSCTAAYSISRSVLAIEKDSVSTEAGQKFPSVTALGTSATPETTDGIIAGRPPEVGEITVSDTDLAACTGILMEWEAPLSWNDGGVGSGSFDVLRDGDDITDPSLASTTLDFTDATAICGVTYTYSVRATNGCGASTTTAGAEGTDVRAIKGVPDGRQTGSIPMTATKISDTSITVTYDATTCSATGDQFNLFYGSLSSVGTYGFVGDECNIGESTPGSYNWTLPVGAGNLFWLIVGEVGTRESSWGQAFDGTTYTERSTAASGRCESSSIDTTSTCP